MIGGVETVGGARSRKTKIKSTKGNDASSTPDFSEKEERNTNYIS